MEKKRIKKRVYALYLGYVAVLAGCLGIVASCSEELATDSGFRESDTPVPVQIRSLGLHDTPATRGVLTTDQTVGFFMGESNGYKRFNNHKGTYANGFWSPIDQLWLSSVKATLAVYHPYIETNKAATLPMAAGLRTDASKDLCSAIFQADNKTTVGTVIMSQRYSRLLVKVVKINSYVSPGKWTLMTLAGDEIYTTGTFDPIGETYTRTVGTVSSGTLTKTLGTNSSASDVASADMLMIPAESMTHPVNITLTVDGRTLGAAIPASQFKQGIAPGKVQTIVLTVSPLGLTVASVETTDWVTVEGDNVTVDADNP